LPSAFSWMVGGSPLNSTQLDSTDASAGGFPMEVILVLCGAVVSAVIFFATHDDAPPRWQALLVVVGFLMTIIWLDLVANEMIALIHTIGLILHVSPSILALTVIAIGNSIGDFVADTSSARQGTVAGARMALAACFGSPVIMNIVSVGLSFTLRLAITGGVPIYFPETLSPLARLGYVLLYLTMASHLLVFPLCGYRAPRLYALYLFAIYITMLIVSVLMEIGFDALAIPLCRGPLVFIFGECPNNCG